MPLPTEDVFDAFPRGIILAWHAQRGEHPPRGWAVCDGRNGTPNLTHRFLRGVSMDNDFYDYSQVGQMGGSSGHAHSGACSGRTGGADQPDGWNFDDPNRNVQPQATGYGHTHPFSGSISTDERDHTPPYVGTVFIMKL